MALMSYLIRDRLGTYYFRRVVPPGLRTFMPPPWTGKANWKQSLRTKDPTIAKRAASRLGARCSADFEAAERSQRGMAALPSAEPVCLRDIEQDALARILRDDDAARADSDARKQLQTPEERALAPDLVPIRFGRKGMEEDHHLAYGEELGVLAADYRKALARSDPGIVDVECRALLRRRGIPIDPGSDAYRETGLAVLRAHVRGYSLLMERQRGEIVATPATVSTDRGPKLLEAYEAWRAGSAARGGRKPSERTLLEAEHAVRRLVEWCGDIRLSDLSREKARDFRDALASVPKRLTGDLRRLPLRDLLKKDLGAYPAVHAGTVNKSLNILAAIVSHAENAGKLDSVSGFRNPFGRGTKLEVDARVEESRQPFSGADLKAIFSSPIFSACDRPKGSGGDAAFWLPLIVECF